MIPRPLLPWLTATRRRQRVALIGAMTPFYLAFALGWMLRSPLPLFVGAIGLAVLAITYRLVAKPHPPLRPRQGVDPVQAAEGEEA
ncbi:hypothetical protein [Sphingobium ummariense]|uniref:Uncharacterized protein n=1 Tax=Sphingobium ummariense RL-3 TaxID=1346791 RepID=T0KA28_9SPHN|nr:hypothetical protein [Sphingobium ummariense]EQB33559.1 hypothetical protein M529_03545 [Sphingobium ummariense RL-3]